MKVAAEKKDHKNYPLDVAVETQLLIVFIDEHFIQSFIQLNIKQLTSFQAIYTRATLICIDLSLSTLSIKLLICNRNGETNLLLSYSTICYPVDLPDKQCLWALTLTLNISFLHSLTFTGGRYLTQVKITRKANHSVQRGGRGRLIKAVTC